MNLASILLNKFMQVNLTYNASFKVLNMLKKSKYIV
jgi:hypothetical protein